VVYNVAKFRNPNLETSNKLEILNSEFFIGALTFFGFRYSSFEFWQLVGFLISKTIDCVIFNHAGVLHEGVTDRGVDEGESPTLVV